MVHKTRKIKKIKEEDLPIVESFEKKYYKVRQTKDEIIVVRRKKIPLTGYWGWLDRL